MRIKKVLSVEGKHFWAIIECVHCGYSYKGIGHYDEFYIVGVLPGTECPQCGRADVRFIRVSDEDIIDDDEEE